MTAGNFYISVFQPVFEKKLKWYFLNRFNSLPIVGYNRKSRFGTVNLEEDSCSSTFFTFHFFNSRLESISVDTDDFKYLDYKMCILPQNFLDISTYSFPSNIKDLEAIYSIELSKCNTVEEFIKDFTKFFLRSVGLEEDFIEYSKQIEKRKNEVEGEVIF